MNLDFKKKIFPLLVLFFVCLLAAIPLFFIRAGDIVTGSFSNPLTSNSFEDLIGNIIDWVANIGIVIAVGMIIFSGLLFMTAGGDKDKVTKARDALIWSLVGLAVLIMGKNWITLIQSILGG